MITETFGPLSYDFAKKGTDFDKYFDNQG